MQPIFIYLDKLPIHFYLIFFTSIYLTATLIERIYAKKNKQAEKEKVDAFIKRVDKHSKKSFHGAEIELPKLSDESKKALDNITPKNKNTK